MKKILVAIVILFLALSGSAFAENEVIFDTATGKLTMPIVIVGTKRYQVEMQQTNGLNFDVISAMPQQTVVGRWSTDDTTGTCGKTSEYFTYYGDGHWNWHDNTGDHASGSYVVENGSIIITVEAENNLIDCGPKLEHGTFSMFYDFMGNGSLSVYNSEIGMEQVLSRY